MNDLIYTIVLAIVGIAIVVYIVAIVMNFFKNLRKKQSDQFNEAQKTRCQAAAKAKKCPGNCKKCALALRMEDGKIVEFRGKHES